MLLLRRVVAVHGARGRRCVVVIHSLALMMVLVFLVIHGCCCGYLCDVQERRSWAGVARLAAIVAPQGC